MLLTVPDVAAELQVTPYTVREYLRTGKLRGFRLAGDGPWRVRRADLDAFMGAPAPRRVAKPRPITGRFSRQVRELPRAGARNG